jgi:Ni,Fe-hydrogenase maturation factor
MSKKTTIYVFGNPLLDFDNLPIKLVPELQKQFPDINFIIQDPNENLKPTYNKSSAKKNKSSVDLNGLSSEASLSSVALAEDEAKEGELIIIDTVVGINEVIVINDIEKLKTDKIYSMHDFDLAFNLKLLKKIGKLKKVTIFGVPQKINKKEALKQLVELIKKIN